jgi:hypothetical protein
MAIAGHEMNGAIIPSEEMRPADWIGRPVTLDHPRDTTGFVAAREDDAIGVIAHAWVEGGKLKSVLKLDAADLPSRVRRLIEREEPLDVSVGYFSEDVTEGNATYSRSIVPDHLALLPGGEGACSWADGCGLRANRQRRGRALLHVNTKCGCSRCAKGGKKRMYLSPTELAAKRAYSTHARGSDDDRRQIIADLISDDRSPFTPDDEESLRMMSSATLAAQAERYLGGKRRIRSHAAPALTADQDPAIRAMIAASLPACSRPRLVLRRSAMSTRSRAALSTATPTIRPCAR